METVARVLVLALIAAASPLALTATIAVLHSGRARLNGAIFAVGFLAGEVIAWAFALILGSALGLGTGSGAIAGALEVALGALLLAGAWRVYHGAVPMSPERSERTKALLARLEHLRPLTALLVGTALGVGIPKRFTITLVAAATVTTAGLTDPRELLLVGLFVIVASVLVWGPVVVYEVAGARADDWLAAGQGWLAARQRGVTLATLVAFGAILVADGLVRLGSS